MYISQKGSATLPFNFPRTLLAVFLISAISSSNSSFISAATFWKHVIYHTCTNICCNTCGKGESAALDIFEQQSICINSTEHIAIYNMLADKRCDIYSVGQKTEPFLEVHNSWCRKVIHLPECSVSGVRQCCEFYHSSIFFAIVHWNHTTLKIMIQCSRHDHLSVLQHIKSIHENVQHTIQE